MRPIVLNEPFRAIFYAPFYVAELNGHWARQGLEVRRDTAGDPSKAAENLFSGKADIAWSGPMRPILLRAKDPSCPLRSFCAVVMKDPFYLLGKGPNPGFALKDLASLRLGSVSEVPTPWWCIQEDIRQAGLDADALNRVTDRSMADNAAAMLAGTLDVAQMFEPFATMTEAKGGAVWHAAAWRGPSAYSALYATEAKIVECAEEFRAMIRGIAEALAWIAKATPEQIAQTVAPLFPDMDRAVLTAALARYQANGIWAATPHFPRDAFESLRTAMKSAGVIPREPSFEECVDDAIVASALSG